MAICNLFNIQNHLPSSQHQNDETSYEDARIQSAILMRVLWLLARQVSKDVKHQWAPDRLDWSELTETQLWVLLEGSIPNALKLACLSRCQWARLTPSKIMKFFSHREIDEVNVNIMSRIKWLHYSTEERELLITNISFQNKLLTAGHLCK